jgi:hypothetical protein
MKTRFAIALAVTGIVFGGAAAETALAATFNDDFSSGLQPTYWSVSQTTPDLWSVDDTHGDVRLAKVGTSPGGLQNVAVHLNIAAVGGPISGDFSEQIDFSDAVVGPNQDQVELHVYFQDGSYFFLVYQTGPNVHVWNGSEHGTMPVAGNSGTFTISRTGSMLTAYYNGSPIYSETNTSPATAMEFINQLQPGSDDNTSVTFDNFSLTAASVPNACTPPPAGMVSWWPGDGNANDIQDGNNGTLQGNITFVPGVVDQAFSSSSPGGSAVIGNPANLQLQTFTFDAWVKLDPPTLTGSGVAAISYGSGGYGFGVAGPSQPPRVSGELFLTQVGVSNVGPGPSMVISDQNWHHIAVTKDGSTVIFYLDGVASAPQTYNPVFTFTTNATVAGSDQPQPFLFDEIEVFNRALSQSEIQAIVNAGSFGKCKGQPTPTPRPRPTARPRPTPAPRPGLQAFIPAR